MLPAVQGTLDASRMHGRAKPLLHFSGEFAGLKGRLVGLELTEKSHHLFGEFVWPAWTTTPGDQARQALLGEPLLGLVKDGTGEAKAVDSLGDGNLLELDTAKHLVLDQWQIAGIEEVAVLELGIADRLRLRVQAAVLGKEKRFVVGAIHGSLLNPVAEV